MSSPDKKSDKESSPDKTTDKGSSPDKTSDKESSPDKKSDKESSCDKKSDKESCDKESSCDKKSDKESCDKESDEESSCDKGSPCDKDLQKTFDSFAKIGGDKEGKISGKTVQQWLKQAGITGEKSGISEEDAKKALPKSAQEKDGGMEFEEFKEYIDKLAKDNSMDPKELKKKLAPAVVSKEKLDKKLDDVKAKLDDQK